MPVPETRRIDTDLPLMGGGDLSVDRTHSIAITPSNDGGAIVKQATSPGTAQSGHFNIDTGIGRLAVQDKGGQVWNVKAFGAKGDTKTVSDGAITMATPDFTSATAGFVPGDVGKVITVRGAGASGATLVTTIQSFVSGTAVTLAANAGATVSNAITNWGTDDTTAIQNAINALPLSGGIVFLPQGDYMISSRITLGNATPTAISTRNSIQLVGVGVGVDTDNLLPQQAAPSGGTRLVWASAAVPTAMLWINGPIEGTIIRDLALDANAIAVTCIDSNLSFLQIIRNILIEHWAGPPSADGLTGFGIILRATNYTGASGGGAPKNNLWENIVMLRPATDTASGISIGPTTGNVNQNTFINLKIFRGSNTSSVGVDLGNCDHNSFFASLFSKEGAVGGIAVRVTAAVNPTTNNFFYGCAFAGGVLQNGAWAGSQFPAVLFLPFPIADGAPLPPNGANSTVLPQFMCAGVSDTGYPFGQYAMGGTLVGIVSSSATLTNNVTTDQVFNKQYTFPANFLAQGQIVRVKTGGRVSTDATHGVNITLALRVGGNRIRDRLFSPVLGASNTGWDLVAEFIIRGLPGTSTTIQRGYGSLTMQADATVSPSSPLTGTFALNLTTPQTVDCMVNFNNLNGIDSITTDYFSVELVTGNSAV